MRFHRGFRLLSIAAIAAASITASAADPADPSGRWVGTILFEEGRMELDLVARFDHQPDGGWTAVLDLPAVGVEAHQVQHVTIEGDRVELRFDLGEGAGERAIAARLDPGGARMEGTFTHGQRSSPLLLERQESAAAAQRVELEVLDEGLEGLRRQFRGDDGDVRLVMLLAPS